MGAASCFRTRLHTKGPTSMAKPELGLKRACVACSARFYDMTKSPTVCPKCGTEQPMEQPRLRRTGGNVAEDKRAKKPAAAPGIEDVDVEVEGAEDAEVEGAEDAEEEDVLEDVGDLEDDADAISADIEVGTDTDEVER